MAGSPNNSYDIYSLGFDKNLIRGEIKDPSIEAPDDTVSQDPSSGSSSDSTSGNFSGGLYNPVTGLTPPSSIASGELPSLIGHGKKLFTDTTAGFLMGVDSDNIYKWIVGNSTSSVDWAVTTPATLTVKGTLNATSGTIGGWTIGASTLTGGDTTLDSTGVISLGTANNIIKLSSVDATYRIWVGNAAAASAPFSVTKAGVVVASNITATGTIYATAGFIGSATALVYESQGINTGTDGHIRGGQTDYDTGTGYFLGYAGGAYKFSIGVGGSTTNNLTWDGANLTVNGYVVKSKGAFGGDGSDGALSITSGTTTIDCAFAAVVFKNYTSISITGTGKLAFSNPNSAGTIVFLKSQGPITLTSSTAPMVDMSGMGADAGAGGTPANTQVAGFAGTEGTDGFGWSATNKGGLGNPRGGAVGSGGAANAYILDTYVKTKLLRIACGAGGGGGGTGGGTVPISGVYGNLGGAGGRGGGSLIIECGGAWNFTTASGISVAGGNGVNGGTGNSAFYSGGGGGGGGGGGTAIVLYNTLTANTGTITISGGTAGSGGAGTNDTGGVGGGGGSNQTAGTSGSSNSGASGGAGGTGGNGHSLVIQNTLYA